jgi:hypothetical protein
MHASGTTVQYTGIAYSNRPLPALYGSMQWTSDGHSGLSMVNRCIMLMRNISILAMIVDILLLADDDHNAI